MKRNPVMPYALIAVLGITLMIVISFVGLNQMTSEDGEGGGEQQEATTNPEEIYQQNCASCHGGDLSGQVGPSLQQVGGSLSKDEIANIIQNGKGSMPPQNLGNEQVDAIASWLSEKK